MDVTVDLADNFGMSSQKLSALHRRGAFVQVDKNDGRCRVYKSLSAWYSVKEFRQRLTEYVVNGLDDHRTLG